MKKIIVLTLLSIFLSCNEDEKSTLSSYISTTLEFSFENKEGDDLLNSNGAFNKTDIEVFIIEDGVKKIIANNDSPHFISNERGFHVLFMELANDTTYLKLSKSVTDTIRSQCKWGSNYKYLTTIWYNEQLIWKQENETSLVKIIK